MRVATEAEVCRDGGEQEGVEDQVVEVEEPARPGEREHPVVDGRRARGFAEEHQGAERSGRRAVSTSARRPLLSPRPMRDMLAGRVAVVTGGGRGIGRGVARALAAAGAKVVVNDYGVAVDGRAPSSGPAFDVVAEIERDGGEAVASTDSVADWEGAGRS